MNRVTQQFIGKTLKFVAFWLVFAYLFYLIGSHIKLFIPLIGGLILFGILNPSVNFLQRHTFLNRTWAVVCAMVFVFLLFGSILTWFTLLAVREIEDLIIKWPTYVQGLKHSINLVWPKIQNLYLGLDPKLSETVNQWLDRVGSKAYDFISKALLSLSSLALSLPELFIMMVITLVAAFFITKNWEAYKRYWLHVFPADWRPGLRAIGRDFSKALVGFLRAQLILVSGTIVLTIIGLFILNVRYYLLVGFIAGLFGILPVLGSGLLLVPWGLVEILLGRYGLGLELLALVGILSIIRHVVEPKILGENVGIDPLLVLLSMYIGLEVIGPLGLVIGPFVIIFYKSLQKAGVFRNL